MSTRLRARLIASYIAIILICLVLVSLASIFLLSRFQARLVFWGLADAAVPTARWVSSLLQRDLTPVEIVEFLKEQAEKQEVRILLLTPGDKSWLTPRAIGSGNKPESPWTKSPKTPGHPMSTAV